MVKHISLSNSCYSILVRNQDTVRERAAVVLRVGVHFGSFFVISPLFFLLLLVQCY